MSERFISYSEDSVGRIRRIRRFMQSYQDLAEGDDIVMYGGDAIGSDHLRVAAVLIEVGGMQFPFTTGELRLMAEIADGTPLDGFDDLASKLRQGADAADARFNSGRLQ